MAHKKYWKDLDEHAQTERYKKLAKDEFQEDLPAFNLSDKLLNAKTPRRDFLKYVGFSTLAATVAASCEMPVRHAIPYAFKPDDVIQPGVPNYYASTFVDNGECLSVLVKTRDGRPILVQGNEESSIFSGGSSVHSLAATLSLYDNARLRQPYVNGKQVDTFAKVDTPIKQALAAAGNGIVYLVTGTIVSPTLKVVISRFLAKYPNAKHIQYDPVSYTGMILANEASYGKRSIPSYHFDKAQTIFSLGADFLGNWLAPVEFTAGYMKNRTVKGSEAKNAFMSKHYQVEPTLTTTGVTADERATCKPSEFGAVAAALYEAVTTGAKPSFASAKLNKVIMTAAADLKKGNGLVVSGSNDVHVQTIINAINDAIGANGTTINWALTSNYKQAIDADMVSFVNDLKAGKVSGVLFHNVNPAYDYFDAEALKEGLKKVKLSVSFNDRMDETTELCKYAVPDNHWLESWGDAEPKSGYYSFIQPTIAPLFKTRAFGDSLMLWADEAETYYDLFNDFWINKLGSQTNFDKAIQDGVAEPADMPFTGAVFSGNIAAAIAKAKSAKNGDGFEIVVYESNAIGYGGAWSNNPWLQELPDPIAKACWDNYICMSPKTAREKFDAGINENNQVVQKNHLMKVKVGNKSVILPMVVVPGMNNDVVAIALGYGRSKGVGPAAHNVGRNVYPFVSFNGQTFSYSAPVEIIDTGDVYPVAITQTHMSAEKRPIIHEFTLEEFKKNPKELIEERNEEMGRFTELNWKPGAYHGHENPEDDFDLEGYRKNGTLYPDHPMPGIHWGMSIDLNSCTGCAACVIACQAENNISVVGKDQVLEMHDMAWMRIDRYYSGNPDDPDSIQAIFQPMMCQHCDNAPCENVCPVSATNHSSEGLNQMAYNRCIGTKYCANNCPFKVRRFNWFDWNGADCFDDNLFEDYKRDDINSDLTRMLLNPDVTVRSRGVMEKCTMCVQRLQDAKLEAKKAGRPLQDGEAKTACQVACASGAIKFGNVNDKESEIYKIRHSENKERVFYVLEELHVLPNVNYLSRIRNADEVVMNTEHDEIYNQHI